MRRNCTYELYPFVKSFGLILFVLTSIMLLTVSCKKEKKDDKEIVPPLPANSISLDKTTVTPGDLVTITSEVSLNRDSWEIKAGSKAITLAKVDDKTASFLSPYVPP
ncbi:MAG TPA: hypothetical protein VLZ28_02945, partial [Daejeonella sp.]|nr:hypothetical protein [Daejeonella sp.]